jgi:tRNA threonylcarbamoyladenosine dehydratase
MANLSWLGRTELLVGTEGVLRLNEAHVLVVGLGGVGSFAAEFIARAGIGEMTIVDGDVVDPSNRNRQLPALATTHGVSKAEWMAERIIAINPEIILHVRKDFLTPEKADEICQAARYHFVMDCIDSITPKLHLIASAKRCGLNIVSSMGAGGKLDPTRIKVADINDTYTDHFATHIRKRLKIKGICHNLITVFSDEPAPKEALMLTDGSNFKKSAYGTISYVPAAFGGVCASVVIRSILGEPIPLHKNKDLDAMKKRRAAFKRGQEAKAKKSQKGIANPKLNSQNGHSPSENGVLKTKKTKLETVQTGGIFWNEGL